MAKKEKDAKQLLKSQDRKAEIIRKVAPIVLIVSILLAIFCMYLAIRHSFGNINEMVKMLDNKGHTGVELEQNYQKLIDKYGEWVIGSGGTGFTIRFIDIKKVAFSGFVLLNFFMSIFFLVFGLVMGKWILPKIARQIEKDNQTMINCKILDIEEKLAEKKE